MRENPIRLRVSRGIPEGRPQKNNILEKAAGKLSDQLSAIADKAVADLPQSSRSKTGRFRLASGTNRAETRGHSTGPILDGLDLNCLLRVILGTYYRVYIYRLQNRCSAIELHRRKAA